MINKETLREKARQSRRYPFIAEHRGGPLTKEEHKLLIHWARECITRVLPLFGDNLDKRLEHALRIAEKWENGSASVGVARQAAFGAIDTANELKDPTLEAVARGVGHTVATAHMADHAPGAAEYALKALASEGKPIDEERKWQDEQLPPEIKELVLSNRKAKNKFWQQHIQNTKKI